MIEIILKHPSSKIIDVGCSEGYSTAEIADKFPEKQVIGVDISNSHLNMAREKIKKINILFQYANALTLSAYIHSQVCAIFAHNSVNILAEFFPASGIPKQFITQAVNVLEENGVLIVINDKGTDYFIFFNYNGSRLELSSG